MRTLVTLVFLLSSILTLPQDQNVPKEIAALSFLVGDWSIENFENKKDDGWVSTGSSKADIRYEHDGRFLSERARYITGFGEINMITHIGFDSRVNTYKLSAMDKEYGLMDIYFGEWSDKRLVFTNLESDRPISLEDGQKLSFRLSYMDIGQDGFTHLVEGTFDGGATWFIFSKSVYVRANKRD